MKSIKGAPVFFNSFLRYKTSILRCSPKKFKSIACSLKTISLNKAIDISSASRKSVCGSLYKDLYAIKKNLLNVLLLGEKVVDQMQIGFVVTEPGKQKRVGTRFKARGKGSRSETSCCIACIYLKNNNIKNFSDFIKNHKEQNLQKTIDLNNKNNNGKTNDEKINNIQKNV